MSQASEAKPKSAVSRLLVGAVTGVVTFLAGNFLLQTFWTGEGSNFFESSGIRTTMIVIVGLVAFATWLKIRVPQDSRIVAVIGFFVGVCIGMTTLLLFIGPSNLWPIVLAFNGVYFAVAAIVGMLLGAAVNLIRVASA